MINKTIKKRLLTGILTLSVLSTSFGGAFATSAYAATPEEISVDVQQEKKSSSNGVLMGLLAIGLISAISNNGGSSDNNSAASKSTVPTTTTKPQTQSPTTTTSSNAGTVSTTKEQQALQLLNNDRAAHGLPALKFNSKLTTLAENYAKDMINRGFFSHYTPEGLSPFDRMSRAGIGYRTAGENLAINSSVAGAETAFMNSSGHRANILNSTYSEVGIGVVQAPNGSLYVVQEFIGK
ncbi:CAP domain-containing protein [Dendrosporobacter sp. 1207_IL3150]|uniref:CAP domain-containing protein n=1 Tax=Dendrosporobacter sp. 1207_IL3150 TaxID=3084054 RepID=UPI002FD988F1